MLIAPLIDEYLAVRTSVGAARALRVLRDRLHVAPAEAWRRLALALVSRRSNDAAIQLMEAAVAKFPASSEARVGLGEALTAAGDYARAEAVLAPLVQAGADRAAVLAMASLLRNQGKLAAAARAIENASATLPDAQGVVDYAKFLQDTQRHALALSLCERALGAGATDPRISAMAGQLALVLGRFPEAREHLLRALDLGIDLNAWYVARSLSDCQRYTDPAHPDLARFAGLLQRPDLVPTARAAVLFALAKAHDDLGQYAQAAERYGEGNALLREKFPWSRQRWRDWVESLLAAPAPKALVPRSDAFVPVFIVGMPRSGTTLVAEILGRHPQVRNRGELSLLSHVHRWSSEHDAAHAPEAARFARTLLEQHLVQDDAPARYYVDKNPLNFCYLGTVAALAPEAKIIHCRRDRRDVALSLWKQVFARVDSGYTYDFAAIADMCADSGRLMEHWQRTTALPVMTVDYEKLIDDPQAVIGELARFLDLTPADLLAAPARTDAPIVTSSVWQARQPIYKSSVAAWRHYAPYVPELEQLFS